MHILVVEDEHLALDDLLSMLAPLASKHSIIGCASSGEALIQAQKQSPDLVIVDIRMPGMNGLELVRRLRADNAMLAAIVLSGHSEFEYAREGLRLGITDYLLKPVRTDSLLQTLERSLADLAEKRAQTTQLREARLVRLLLGGAQAAEADRELWTASWGMIVCLCENWESPLVWRDTSLKHEDFAHIIALHGFSECDVLGIDGHIRVVLFRLNEQATPALELTARALHRMILAAGVLVHTTFTMKPVGISPASLLPNVLRRLSQAIHFAAPSFIRADLAPEVALTSCVPEQLRLLERSLADAKIPAAIEQLHAILIQLRQAHATQEDLIEMLKQVFTLFQHYLHPLPSESFPDRSTIVSVLRRLRSYEELNRWLILQLQPLLEQQRGSITPRQLVHTLVVHMHTNYADNTSLQDFVAENGVSLAYFSRLFKDEVGMTFSDYLTHIRMEKAKQLLNYGTLRPAEISGLVGYEDPKYFSQVFRRIAGMTPLDYQRSHQQEP